MLFAHSKSETCDHIKEQVIISEIKNLNALN